MSAAALLESPVEGIPVRRGKVRDIYDFGDRFAICNPVDGSHNGCVGIGKQADRAG